MSARKMAEAVGSRFSRDKGDRIAPHGDALAAPTNVTEAEEQGVLGMSRDTRERMLGEVDPYAGAPPRDLAKVLGKGVHPRALNRLVELWPEAYVVVRHDVVTGRLPFRGARPRPAPGDRRWTTVTIYNRKPVEGDAGRGLLEAQGRANCSPLDQFDRRSGIRLAFNRALKAAKAAESVRVMESSRA